MLATLIQDIRYCLSTLRANPGFALLAIVTLTLGVGANTAVFSIVHAVLLRPLPFPDPDRLVTISPHEPGAPPTALYATSAATFYDWRVQATAFEEIAAFDEMATTMTGRGEPQRLSGVVCAANVLKVLGVQPILGRWFTDAEDAYGAPGTIVISHTLWHRLFNGAPTAIGQSLTLGDRAFTIVGVMPPDFAFPNADNHFWMPAQFEPSLRQSRTEYFLFGVGRLRADLPVDRAIDRATAELNGVMARLRQALPNVQDPDVSIAPLKQMYTSDVQRQLLVLMAAVAIVLVIACANLANVLLARASGRGREMAVRQALGASRGRLARQLLTESATLGLIGGGTGLIVGWWSLQALVALLPEDLPRREEIRLDTFILLATLGMSLIVGIVFGLAPAWRLTRARASSMLRDGARTTSARGRLRGLLVVAEVALALILLIGAGLLLRSFSALRRVDPGVRIDGVQTFRVNLPATQIPPPQRLAFFEAALERLAALPGVQSAAIINNPPVTGRGVGAWLNIVGRPTPPGRNPEGVPYRVVSTGYFTTTGIPLLRGRLPTPDDTRTHSPSVVIDRALAARFWPNEDPIGREIILGALPDNVLFPRATIVGIVGDVRQLGLHAGSPGMVYVPHRLMPSWAGFAFMVRTSGDPNAIIAPARAAIRTLNPLVPISQVQSMEEIVVRSMAGVRSSMLLLGTFAGLALAMATVGVFGVLSFVVSQRHREMGIRLALGADPNRLVRRTIAEGMRQVLAGIAIGVTGAVLLTRAMSTLLYGVTPTDPLTFAGVIGVVAALSLLACYLPARGATRVNPVAVLKAE